MGRPAGTDSGASSGQRDLSATKACLFRSRRTGIRVHGEVLSRRESGSPWRQCHGKPKLAGSATLRTRSAAPGHPGPRSVPREARSACQAGERPRTRTGRAAPRRRAASPPWWEPLAAGRPVEAPTMPDHGSAPSGRPVGPQHPLAPPGPQCPPPDAPTAPGPGRAQNGAGHVPAVRLARGSRAAAKRTASQHPLPACRRGGKAARHRYTTGSLRDNAFGTVVVLA
jgi:hypothetical protein